MSEIPRAPLKEGRKPASTQPPPTSETSPKKKRGPRRTRQSRPKKGARAAKGPLNPGKYDDISKAANDIVRMVGLFEGFRCDYARLVHPGFQITHEMSMAGEHPPSYNLVTTYAGEKSFLMARWDHDGNLVGRANYTFTPNLIARFQAQAGVGPVPSNMSGEAECKGPDYTALLKLQSTGTFICNYMQSITRSAAAGCELIYDHPNASSLWGAGFRYQHRDYTMSAQYHSLGDQIQLAYTHNIDRAQSNRIQATAELSAARGRDTWDSVATFGFQYRFRMSTTKGTVDTRRRITIISEEKLNQFFSYCLCGEIDYAASKYKIGFGISAQI